MATASAQSYRREESVFAGILRAYGRTWVSYALSALFIAVIANGIYHIPLWQVVDVNLSVFLFGVGLWVTYFVILVVLDIVSGDFGPALWGMLGIVLWALMPFGAISGYMIYGWFGGAHIGGESFVYDGFINLFAKGYTLASSGVTQVAALIGSAKDAAPAVVGETKLDMNVVSSWATVGSFVIALVSLLRGSLVRAI